MALADLTDPNAVQRAVREFDELGRDQFLSKYGFGKSRSYFLIEAGRSYDSKAIAGAAHGYQHPTLGPLGSKDFSGGDATVRARLEALGFTVVVTEPKTAPSRPLTLFEDYSRREVHDIFAPQTDFTPGAGQWGLQGIIEHQPGEFLVFVTFGREQGEHKFDEGVTSDGVLTWQSQPNQTLETPQVKQLIAHDSERGNLRLFLRTRDRSAAGAVMPYTYLGRLSYLTHDAERERPVYFQWQLIDRWPPADAVLVRMGLALAATEQPAIEPVAVTAAEMTASLTETPPPMVSGRKGRRTADFRARKSPDRSVQDAKNRQLGLAGEVAVVTHEQTWLSANGRDDLAVQVRHVAVVEGDGTGYDVKSFELDGSDKFIEVKTTRGGMETDFLITANEIEFSKRHTLHYRLYRLYGFDAAHNRGSYFVRRGSLVEEPSLELLPVVFRARLIPVIAMRANHQADRNSSVPT